MATGTKIIPAFVVGALIGGGITYFGLSYPAGNALFGAVAPAQRYQAEQPSADQIALGDESLQAVMQSDAFAKLVADEAFQEAILDDEFVQLMQGAGIRAFVTSGAAQELVADAGLQELVRNDAIQELISESAFAEDNLVRGFVASKSFSDRINAFINANRDALASAEEITAGEQAALGERIAGMAEEINAVFARNAENIMGERMFLRAQRNLADLVSSDAFNQLMLSPSAREAIISDEFINLVQSGIAERLAQTEDFAALEKLINNRAINNLVQRPAFERAMAETAIANLIAGPRFAAMLQNGEALNLGEGIQENIRAQ